MTPDRIREAYLAFFEQRGHTRWPSDSLVPENDPTLLFTGAGMNQFKAMFLGRGNLPFKRATTTQKCVRMPDLENVGRTASHHTFFEMLGNFSFGDYFKQEAICWAKELLDALGVPADRLSVTVYTDDDEAAAIWVDAAGMPAARIFRGGEDENFWPASAPSQGPNGVCGPCSEIYFDMRPEDGPIPAAGPAADGRRFVEIWNLVFTQFDRRDGGLLQPLPQRNIDTGMGFERIVRVLETVRLGRTVPSNFETPLFAPLLEAIHAHVGRTTEFGTPDGTRVRRIADHVRAASFCIGDGVRPSNERQGYVVRKVLRRAMLDRHLLGGDLRSPWLARLSETIVDHMAGAFPELRDARSMIASTIAAEEDKFAGAFLGGSQKLAVMADEVVRRGGRQFSGDAAFLLYDTFGLPLDLQKLLLEEQGLALDEEGFRRHMAEQRRRSREGSRIPDAIFDEGPLAAVRENLPATEFVRDRLQLEDAAVLAVVDDTEGRGEDEGRRVLVVLDRTPFYAEGGGQVGDCGEIEGADFLVEVDDTVSLRGITLHRGVVVRGRPAPGPAAARVDAERRAATARNHTGTHLLHAALREVLGDEASQAGSLVTPERLRFDFRFPRALSAAELRAIEDGVNRRILVNAEVESREMAREAARAAGAVALFGEKYGEVVRVVAVPARGAGADSVELCGGTHIRRSGDIGLLRIVSESSIAAGVRRIEARTGTGLLEHVRGESELLARLAARFKTSPEQLEERLGASLDDLRTARRQLEELRARVAGDQLASGIRSWRSLRVLVAAVPGLPVKTLRELAQSHLEQGCDLVLVAVPEEGATSYLAAAGEAARKLGLSARALVAALAAALDGKGGGTDAFAQGRGGEAGDLPALLQGLLDQVATDRV